MSMNNSTIFDENKAIPYYIGFFAIGVLPVIVAQTSSTRDAKSLADQLKQQ